eukprot:553907-Prorocentrum_minimum.AAC.5
MHVLCPLFLSYALSTECVATGQQAAAVPQSRGLLRRPTDNSNDDLLNPVVRVPRWFSFIIDFQSIPGLADPGWPGIRPRRGARARRKLSGFEINSGFDPNKFGQSPECF